MQTFYQWTEAVVATKNINRAIKESIDFIVGKSAGYNDWDFKTDDFQNFTKHLNYGQVGNKEEVRRCRIYFSAAQSKGYFFVQAWTEVKKDVQEYDPKKGDENITIEADIFARMETDKKIEGGFKKLDTAIFHTPYEFAKWVKEHVDEYHNDEDGGWQDVPVDPALDPVLVPVRPRRA